jgi:hypothetical protein
MEAIGYHHLGGEGEFVWIDMLNDEEGQPFFFFNCELMLFINASFDKRRLLTEILINGSGNCPAE